jgi:O-antigen ligase
LGARIAFFQRTVEAAIAFMPLGSGLGTFAFVYALFEQPEDALGNIYANHAHNEIVQVWLETGLMGIALMGAFGFWFVTRSVRIWRGTPVGMRDIDSSLARAGTLITALVIAHSLVDDPLHTGGMMAIFAFACGLMTEPVTQGLEERPAPTMKGRAARPKIESKPLSPPSRVVAGSTGKPSPSEEIPQHAALDADIVWPHEWSSPSSDGLADPGSDRARQVPKK